MIRPPDWGPQRYPIHTATGREVWYLEPARTEVVEWDLYLALSRQCRYAGAVEWTVLQHLALCVALAEPYGVEVQRYAAAHDLHEAYVPDLPWILTRLLPYKELGVPWERHVHEAVGLTWPPPESVEHRVHAIDRLAVWLEVHAVPSSEAIRTAVAAEHDGKAPPESLLDLARACLIQPRGLWARVWRTLPIGASSSRVLEGLHDPGMVGHG